MTKHGITVIATAMAMAVAAAASAAPVRKTSADGTGMEEDVQPPEAPPARAYVPDTGEAPGPTGPWRPFSGVGVALMFGGGVTNYTKNVVQDATDVGGSWGFRFTVRTRRWLSFDASYGGGSSALTNVLGTPNNESVRLNRNGIEGAFRINLPLSTGNTLLSPYALAGAGWAAYKVTNAAAVTANASSGLSTSNDNVFTVPLAVGFAAGYKGFIGDIRGTFRPTYFQSIFVGESGSSLTNWDAGAMVGYEF